MPQSYQQWIPAILSIAEEASEAILAVQSCASYEINVKLDKSPVTEADLLSDRIIQAGLFQLDPDLPYLSEEGQVFPLTRRATWDRFWLIDPLDGTRDFIKGGKEFVINIALIENHAPVLGVIAVPHQQAIYWAVKGQGAFYQKIGEPARALRLKKGEPSALTMTVSRNIDHLQGSERALLERLPPATFIHCSSALKFCLLAGGEAHIYPRFGTVCEWDIAAGQILVEEAGGQVVDLAGLPIRYNLNESLKKTGFYAVSSADLVATCCG
jgi:3'(2'), 5'-bisphosphate nucleotidase